MLGEVRMDSLKTGSDKMGFFQESRQLCSTLQGEMDMTDGPNSSTTRGDIITRSGLLNQGKILGNRCGHNKNNFKKPPFYGSSGYKGRRSFSIKRSIETLNAIIFHRSSSERGARFRNLLRERVHSSLRIMELFENKRLKELFFHDPKSEGENSRAIRSESVEATNGIVEQIIIDGVDLRTMAFGFFDYEANKQVYFDYNYIVRKSGLSLSRVQRAITRLKKLNLITVDRIVTKSEFDGKFKHKETRIYVSPEIFTLLGVEEQFLKDRSYAETEHRKKMDKINLRKAYLEKNKFYNTEKNKKHIKELKQNIGTISNKKSFYQHRYNPASDKQVISLASELIKSNHCDNLRQAIILACSKLGKPPPD